MVKRLSSISGAHYEALNESELHLAILVSKLRSGPGHHDNPVAITPSGDPITISAITTRLHIDLTEGDGRGKGYHYRCPNSKCTAAKPGEWGVLHVIKPGGRKEDDPPGAHDKYMRHGRRGNQADGGCGESILHRVSADLFMQAGRIAIPVVTDIIQPEYLDPNKDPARFHLANALGLDREHWVGTYRADVHIEINGRPALIEIRYSNKAPSDRRKEYERHGLPVLEVDVRHSEAADAYFNENDHDAFIDYILRHAPRKWLFHPDVSAREAREEAENLRLIEHFKRENQEEHASDPDGKKTEVRALRISSMIKNHRLRTISERRNSIWFTGDSLVWQAAIVDRSFVTPFQADHEAILRTPLSQRTLGPEDHIIYPSDPKVIDRIPHLAARSWRISQYAPSGEKRPEVVVWEVLLDSLKGRPGVKVDRRAKSISFHYDTVVEIGLTASIMKLVAEIYSRYDQGSIAEAQVISLTDRWMDQREYPRRAKEPGGGKHHISALDTVKSRLQYLIVYLDKGFIPADNVHFHDIRRALPTSAIQSQGVTNNLSGTAPTDSFHCDEITEAVAPSELQDVVAAPTIAQPHAFRPSSAPVPPNSTSPKQPNSTSPTIPTRPVIIGTGMVLAMHHRKTIADVDTPELRKSVSRNLGEAMYIRHVYKRIHDELAINWYRGLKEHYLLEKPVELQGKTRREYVVDRPTLETSIAIPSPLDSLAKRAKPSPGR